MHLRIEGSTATNGLTSLSLRTSPNCRDHVLAVKQALQTLEEVNAPLEVWGTPGLGDGEPNLTITLPVFANSQSQYGTLTELVDMSQLTSTIGVPAESSRKTVWIERQISPTYDTEIKKSGAVTYFKMPDWQEGIRCFGLTHMWPWTTLGIYALGPDYTERCNILATRLCEWIHDSEQRIPLRCIKHTVADTKAMAIHIAMYCFKPQAPYQLLMWDPLTQPPKKSLRLWKGYDQQGTLENAEKRHMLLQQGQWPLKIATIQPGPL